MASVARNTHIPKLSARHCCAASWNCSATPSCSPVVIGPPVDNRLCDEVVLQRRRCGLPLQPGGTPGIVRRLFPAPQRMEEIDERQAIAGGKEKRAHGGDLIQELVLLG